jgi:hypothetical protein
MPRHVNDHTLASFIPQFQERSEESVYIAFDKTVVGEVARITIN